MATTDTIHSRIEELGPWFHNIHLPDGAQTAPDHFLGDFPRFKWDAIKDRIPEDLTGKTVLDIGCNAGFYSMELASRGAQVTAIDMDPRYLKQAEWVAGQFGLGDRVTVREQQVYDLAAEREPYDLVWFMGVFYHLRYPLLALDIISRITRETLLFQTLTIPGDESVEIEDIPLKERERLNDAGWPKMAFIENRLNGDPTNWWAANNSGIEAMLRSSGFQVKEKPDHEVYLCHPDPERPGVSRTWNESEYLSAIGREWRSTQDRKVG